MREGAPILHEDLKTKEFGEQTSRVSNVSEHFRHAMGDIDTGFAEAEITVEREFNTATVSGSNLASRPTFRATSRMVDACASVSDMSDLQLMN